MTPVKKAEEDIGQQNYNFVKISQLATLAAGEHIDIIAVASSFNSLETITSSKTGKELLKRNVTLLDDTAKVCYFDSHTSI